jgi:hypothetical protein
MLNHYLSQKLKLIRNEEFNHLVNILTNMKICNELILKNKTVIVYAVSVVYINSLDHSSRMRKIVGKGIALKRHITCNY